MRIAKDGIAIGWLAITWLDLWTGYFGLEIAWHDRCILHVGFHEPWRRCN